MNNALSHFHADAIAIVGMAGQFAGARDVAELWTALQDGRELITHYDRQDLLSRGVPAVVVDHPDYVAARGAIADPLGFDASFFGYSAREAELMDPQQRLVLETAWHVAEDAGLPLPTQRGRIGVFAATAHPTYTTTYPPQADIDPMEVQLGNDPDFAAARVSYKLDLDGPSIGVATACSSGLTAVHLACQSLINGDSDLAFALAASIRFPADRGLTRVPGSILAGDGHCRPFAADADGTVEADGAAGVALRRLDEALADGDRIHAVILGSAVGSDGAERAGFTAPGVAGQRRILESALRYADISPDEVAYVEAHGTGTRLGDPIETRALAAVYGTADRSEPLRIGSLKSNVGHLNHVAGLGGLIKVVLSLTHAELPPSLHLGNGLNPELDLAGGRLAVQARLEAWPSSYQRRVAAVSSFGMGGSGAHVVLTSAPPSSHEPEMTDTAAPTVLPLSARSPEALSEMGARLARWLTDRPEVAVADVAHTLRHRRSSLAYRAVVAGVNRDELVSGLAALPVPTQPTAGDGAATLLFPGQGSERPGMAAKAYAEDSVFRDHLDDALGSLPEADAARLRDYLLDPTDPGHGTALAQPALLAVQYSHARAWEAAGLEVAGIIGHSVGELTAACLAGVFTLGDGMRLAAARGRLVARSGPGAMLAVRLHPDALAERLVDIDGWDLAAHNSAEECVVAGPTDLVTKINNRLRADGVATIPLDVEHAFHSRALDPLLAEFADVVRAARPQPPTRPYLSCVTGGWVTPKQAVSVDHWITHLRGTVRFADSVETALGDDLEVYVVLGPGRSAATHVRHAGARVVVLGAGDPAADGVARAWTSGVAVAWPPHRGSLVSLPGYPFQHRGYSLKRAEDDGRVDGRHRERLPVDRWFHTESFRPTPPTLVGAETVAELLPRHWRIDGEGPIAEALAEFATNASARVDRSPEGDADLTVLILQATAIPDASDVSDLLAPVWAANGCVGRDVLIVTSVPQAVGSPHLPRPSSLAAAAAAAARVLGQENPHLRITCVDVHPGQDPREVASALARAVVTGRRGELLLVAGRLWARHLEASDEVGPSAIRREGTYLVVGGAGTIGLALAAWLASTYDANVALVGRRPPEQFHAPLEDASRTGSAQIVYFSGDVTDSSSMAAAWAEVESRLGQVNGIIHAAGESATPAFQLLSERTPTRTDPHLQVKGVGTDQLAQLVRRHRPDFVLGLSSLSVLLGGLGFSTYAAANAYQEARFADLVEEQPETTWATLRLDAWEAGNDGTGSVFRSRAGDTISEADAPALFERAFRLLPLGTLSVSVRPLDARIAGSEHPPPAAKEPAEASRHPRPHLSTPYRPAADEFEEAIIELLEDLLHTDGIGGDDDFFELGGHSLLAMTLASRLAEALALDVNLRTVFDAPTAARLATALEEMVEHGDSTP